MFDYEDREIEVGEKVTVFVDSLAWGKAVHGTVRKAEEGAPDEATFEVVLEPEQTVILMPGDPFTFDWLDKDEGMVQYIFAQERPPR